MKGMKGVQGDVDLVFVPLGLIHYAERSFCLLI